MIRFIILFLLITQLGGKLFACEINTASVYNLILSLKDKNFYAYNASQGLRDIPLIQISNCEKLAMTNKYLMVAFGPENLELSNRVKPFDINFNYTDSQCTIENSPFSKETTFSERKEYLSDKINFIKSCVKIYIEEEGNTPLRMPPSQPGCTVEKISDYKIAFNGGYCFVKPNFGSAYSVKMRLNEECTDADYLNLKNIKIFDIMTILNFYAAGDASGSSPDLTALNTTSFRFTIEPNDTKKIPLQDFGPLFPRFPSTYSLPDLYLGEPELFKANDYRVQIKIPLWVDHRCEQQCSATDPLCQSLCDYSTPVVGRFELYEKDGTKYTYLTSWYDGAVAPPHFVGELMGVGFDVPKSLLEAGKTYAIKFVMDDPKFDFERFNKRIQSRLGSLDYNIGKIGNSDMLGIKEIKSLDQGIALPELQGLHSLNAGDHELENVDKSVQILRNYLNFRTWPPYYDKFCHEKDCSAITEEFFKGMVEFKINSMDADENLLLPIKNLSYKKDFASSTSSIKAVIKAPKKVCP